MAPPVTEDQILDALRPIEDPDFKQNIVDLGFVKNIKIDGEKVSFEIELTTPACPIKAEFEKAAYEAVGALKGVGEVTVSMTANTRQSTSSIKEKLVLPGVKNILAVASGKGGSAKARPHSISHSLCNRAVRRLAFSTPMYTDLRFLSSPA